MKVMSPYSEMLYEGVGVFNMELLPALVDVGEVNTVFCRISPDGIGNVRNRPS